MITKLKNDGKNYTNEMFLRLCVRAPRIFMNSIMLLRKLGQPANIHTFTHLATFLGL